MLIAQNRVGNTNKPTQTNKHKKTDREHEQGGGWEQVNKEKTRAHRPEESIKHKPKQNNANPNKIAQTIKYELTDAKKSRLRTCE